MSSERLEELFAAAADLSREERAAFLDENCAGDASLRARVEALLAGLDRDDDLLGPMATPAPTRVGSHIDRYEVQELIAEGGMGQVYAALQREPVERRVALKLIRSGMGSAQVVARFEAERQALARMGHPAIASVLDGGATEDGVPYFVMELVEGQPITEHCDRGALSIDARLELLCRVCEGVQHAHQKGIIHRDLKPSNILVDAQGPRIIDFGVARALWDDGDSAGQTLAGQVVGTLEYMSPEQADPSADGIDTRADIYSLGVVLYELLTGVRPFERDTSRPTPLAALHEALRVRDARRPSSEVRRRTMGEAEARARATDPQGLARRLAGDLDWISLRALEKDPSRRYASASELAADLRRHLAHEPVLARPPSPWYRAAKFARRNRVTVTAAAIVLFVAAAGLFGTVRGQLAAASADLERQAADAKASERGAVVRSMVSMLGLANPERSLTARVPATTLLERFEAEVLPALEQLPLEEQLEYRVLVGRAYAVLGDREGAARHLIAAMDAQEQQGAEPLERYETVWPLVRLEIEAEERMRGYASLDLWEPMLLELLPPEDDGAYATLRALLEEGRRSLYLGQVDHRIAVAIVQEARTEWSARGGEEARGEWTAVADALWVLGVQYGWATSVNTLAAARDALVLAHEIRSALLPEGHPSVALAKRSLAHSLARAGDHEAARRHTRAALLVEREVLSEGHWELAATRSILAALEIELSETVVPDSEHVAALRASTATLDEALGASHPLALRARTRYLRLSQEPDVDRERRTFARAVQARDFDLTPVWPLAREAFGPEHAAWVAAVDGWDRWARTGKRPEGLERGTRLKEHWEALSSSPDRPDDELLEGLFLQSISGWGAVLGARTPVAMLEEQVARGAGAAFTHRLLGAIYRHGGRLEEALAADREVFELKRDGPPLLRGMAQLAIGATLVQLGIRDDSDTRFGEAEVAMLAARECYDSSGSPRTPVAAEPLAFLLHLYTEWRPEGATERIAPLLDAVFALPLEQDWHHTFHQCAIWFVVRVPGLDGALYERAADAAEALAATGARPTEPRHLFQQPTYLHPVGSTLGTALLRAGRFEAALEALDAVLAEELTGPLAAHPRCADEAVRAMALLALERPDEARASLERARALEKEYRPELELDARALLDEATAALSGR